MNDDMKKYAGWARENLFTKDQVLEMIGEDRKLCEELMLHDTCSHFHADDGGYNKAKAEMRDKLKQ